MVSAAISFAEIYLYVHLHEIISIMYKHAVVCYVFIYIRGETILVNAILCIVFECIAIYCHISICHWILVKIFHMGIWVLIVKKEYTTLYNHITI